MKISYNWLRDYLRVDLEPNRVSEMLTSIGLEVENVESYESVPGGLKGLVVGEVVSCSKHPNADQLSLTTVDIGMDEKLPIVCGAPNVQEGQKVIVAPVGATLHGGDEPFQIKKVKIRGEVSQGMICAEDEIGIGDDHSGIIILADDVQTGTMASEIYQVEEDTIFEIGLTPNRIDGASHIGAARDLRALLNLDRKTDLELPSVEAFSPDNHNLPIQVYVESTEACPRYSGVSISGITVKESPNWLKTRISSIGLFPINNIVDITNYVLHETGQPLHAFDADKISGSKIIVKCLPENTLFVSLDEKERQLSENDLMICDERESMCIGGVFGGIHSGVTERTTDIFLESACFNPISIRRSSKRHQLFTDASFRFERGTDPNGTLYALKRAALLIKEIAGGKISSDVIDVYPEPIAPYRVELTWKNLDRLIGVSIDRDEVRQILDSLDIHIVKEMDHGLLVNVATYRVDVRREVDVIEEVLRIYGYNNIGFEDKVNSTLAYAPKPDPQFIENLIADQLVGQGLNEIMSNSLTNSVYYNEEKSTVIENTVKLHNPLSNELGAMRQTLLFGGLESIARNIKHKNLSLKLFEFGNVYQLNKQNSSHTAEGYQEHRSLVIIGTGHFIPEHWHTKPEELDYFILKTIVYNILERMGLRPGLFRVSKLEEPSIYSGFQMKTKSGELVGKMGQVHPDLAEKFEIEQAIWFAELNFNLLVTLANSDVSYKEVPKYPSVRRDLALILDEDVTFEQIENLAFLVEKKILKSVNLFDLFISEKIGAGKKSLAVSFILLDEQKTLTDKQIEKTMNNLLKAFEQKLGAKLR